MPLPTKEPFALVERDLRRSMVRLAYVIETSENDAEVEKAEKVLAKLQEPYKLVENDKR